MARSRRSEPVLVGMYLCAQMHDAIADLAPEPTPPLTPAGFYSQFLGWVRSEPGISSVNWWSSPSRDGTSV